MSSTKAFIHGLLSILGGFAGLHLFFARKWFIGLLKFTPWILGWLFGNVLTDAAGNLSSLAWANIGLACYILGFLWYGADIIMTLLGLHTDKDGDYYRFSESWIGNFIRWIGVVVIVVILGSSLVPTITGLNQHASTSNFPYTRTMKACFTMREKPSFEAKKITLITGGTELNVLERKGGLMTDAWLKIERNGLEGWVPDEYLNAQKTATVTADSIDIKESRSGTSKTLAAAKQGSRVIVENPNDGKGWANIIYDEIKGWVRSDTIKMN